MVKKSLDTIFNDSKIKTQKIKDDFKYCVENKSLDCIVLPMYLPNEKKTKPDTMYSLNLNSYRNRNFIVNNSIKIMFKEWIDEQLKGLIIEGKFKLLYKIYRKTKLDGSNVFAVIDKFFCDALTESKCIKDDNIEILEGCKWINGGRDKLYPRVEVFIIQ